MRLLFPVIIAVFFLLGYVIAGSAGGAVSSVKSEELA
jgi:hypothetical protein